MLLVLLLFMLCFVCFFSIIMHCLDGFLKGRDFVVMLYGFFQKGRTHIITFKIEYWFFHILWPSSTFIQYITTFRVCPLKRNKEIATTATIIIIIINIVHSHSYVCLCLPCVNVQNEEFLPTTTTADCKI